MTAKKKRDGKESTIKLRTEAEKKVARSSGKASPLKKHDLDKLVHELQVHQVELEMQNEELRRAQEQLQVSKEQYFDLYDIAPVGYFSLNEAGIILEANLTGANMLGVVPRDLRARRLSSLIFKADQDVYYQHRHQLFTTRAPQLCELRMVRKDGSLFWARIEAVMAQDAKNGKPVCHATMSDMTTQKRAEEALRESEEINRRLADYYKRLNDISITFGKAVDTADLFSKIAENFRFITDAIAASFAVYDQEARVLKIMSLSIDPVSRDSVISMLGTDLFKLQIPVSTDDMEQMLAQSIRRPKDLHELSSGQLPRDISDSVMNAIGCRQIIALAISHEVEIMGTCVAYLREDQSVVPDDALTTFISLSALAIKRKRAEEKWQAALAYNRSLIEASLDPMVTINAERHITDVNLATEKVTGCLRGELIGSDFSDYFTEPEKARAGYQQVLTAGFVRDYPLDMRHRDGQITHVLYNAVVYRDEQGQVLGIFAAARDITERKQAEEALRESEELFRVAQEMSPDGFTILHPLRNEKGEIIDFTWVYENKTIARINGTDPEEIKGKRMLDLFPTHKGTSIFETYIYVSNSGKPQIIEEVYVGEIVSRPTWLRLVVVSIGEDIAILAQDITDRKNADEALRQGEAQYRLLADHTKDMVWLMDMNLKTVYLSPSTETVSGFTLQERMELTMEQSLTPESLKLASDLFLKELPSVEADPNYSLIHTLELEYYRKDGTTLWTENTFSVVRDENGKPAFILGEARDISERRQAEESLNENESRLKLAIEALESGIWELNVKTGKAWRSLRHDQIFGYTSLLPEWTYQMFLDHVLPEDRSEVASKYGHALSTKTAWDFECRIRRVDKTVCWIHALGKPSENDDNNEVVMLTGIIRDITDRKLSEEKLLKSYESLKKTLSDAINTMIKIVELRDPYTAGHQQRVADLAVAIAGEMKFEDEQIDQLRMAATIHDIGKIYVPSDILSKPGKLTAIELSLIRTHAQNGYDIVQGMDFPGAVAETIQQHHERLDGSGYPNGLKAEDTLMKAKILAVADVVEAMASHRPYRPALGIDRALEEISKNRGKLYDPDVVDTCLALFKSGNFEFKPV